MAVGLVGAHLLAWGWVVWSDIQYDSGNVLWWLVAFLVLPAVALIALVLSFLRGQLGWRSKFGD
jgi:hypothetical protein